MTASSRRPASLRPRADPQAAKSNVARARPTSPVTILHARRVDHN
ncbi:MAG: hypothetical protein R3B91_15570 [Planctomycetaceae bacterium]